MKKLFLIDGNAIIHRAFHALPPFKSSKGELVNAVYGFCSMLLTILNSEKPDYIAVSFDLKGPTFRHEEYKEYKATRVKAPDGLYEQIPKIRAIVEAFSIPIFEYEGFEADDVLGTLAAQAEHLEDLTTYVVTGDMDALQLISEKTKVLAPFKGFAQTITYDIDKVFEKCQLKPEQIPDMKGLCGDTSDNIKGVAGIGPKTACELLTKYGTIENIYANLQEITGKTKEKLENGRESAFLSKRLATIIRDVPVTLNLSSAKTHEYDRTKVLEIFQDYQFKSLIPKLTNFDNHATETKNSEDGIQPALF